MIPRYLPRLPVSILSAIQLIASAPLRRRAAARPIAASEKSRMCRASFSTSNSAYSFALKQIANDRIGKVIEQTLADDAECREPQSLRATTSGGSSSRRICSKISNCGRIDDCTNSAQAAVGLAISRIMSFECQVSSGPVRTRRMNVAMKSASFVSGRRAVCPLAASGACSIRQRCARHDRLDVQPLLVAEVVVHGGDISTGALTDVSDGGAIETSLGEDLAGRVGNSFTSCICFVA